MCIRDRERGGFGLGNLLDLAVHLGRGRLVVSDLLDQTRLPDRLEDPLGAEAVDVARVFWNVERDPDVRLRAQVVDLVRLELVEQLHHLDRVREVSVVEKQPHAIHVGVAVKMVDPARVEGRGAADDAVHFITLREQELR